MLQDFRTYDEIESILAIRHHLQIAHVEPDLVAKAA